MCPQCKNNSGTILQKCLSVGLNTFFLCAWVAFPRSSSIKDALRMASPRCCSGLQPKLPFCFFTLPPCLATVIPALPGKHLGWGALPSSPRLTLGANCPCYTSGLKYICGIIPVSAALSLSQISVEIYIGIYGNKWVVLMIFKEPVCRHLCLVRIDFEECYKSPLEMS